MKFRRKLNEMTGCASIAPVMSPMSVTLKKRRIQDPKKKKVATSVKEVDISIEADKLVAALLSEDKTLFSQQALDRIQLREPIKKPRVLPKPGGFGASLRSMVGRVGSKIGKAVGGMLDQPPYPTAPEDDQLPISPKAIDRLSMIPDPQVLPDTGVPRARLAGVPSNPVRKVKPWTAAGKPSKGSTDFSPQRTWVRGKFNKNLHPRVAPLPGTAPKITKRPARRKQVSRILGRP